MSNIEDRFGMMVNVCFSAAANSKLQVLSRRNNDNFNLLLRRTFLSHMDYIEEDIYDVLRSDGESSIIVTLPDSNGIASVAHYHSLSLSINFIVEDDYQKLIAEIAAAGEKPVSISLSSIDINADKVIFVRS